MARVHRRPRGGKLRGAARHWALGPADGVDASELAESARVLGVLIEESTTTDTAFAVMPENADTVHAWTLISTQMTATGLRYEGVRAGLALARVRCTAELFAGLQLMERAALEAFDQVRARG